MQEIHINIINSVLAARIIFQERKFYLKLCTGSSTGMINVALYALGNIPPL